MLDTHRRSTCKHQSIAAEQLQLARTKQRKRKQEKYIFNEVRQLPTSSGHKGRDLITQSIHDINTEDNTPLYMTRESTKKRKPTDLDQKQI